jgi:hypothetical protein
MSTLPWRAYVDCGILRTKDYYYLAACRYFRFYSKRIVRLEIAENDSSRHQQAMSRVRCTVIYTPGIGGRRPVYARRWHFANKYK